MARRFLSIGIDHGTTNSAIAVLDGGQARVLRPNPDYDILPSVVYLDARGRILVGRAAREARIGSHAHGEAEGNGHEGYKPDIGEDGRYAFTAAGKVMTAPELGSIVISELLRLYREQVGGEPPGAVITVPAKFEDTACAGTRQAASLAGLTHHPLFQEPLAAALAYGFSVRDTHARWMVFDLGGGTLDVCLLQVRNGRIEVPEEGHGGDNRLGGRVFDLELMGHVLREMGKTYDLRGFSEKSHPGEWIRLLYAVEEAKIQLSEAESTRVELNTILCDDAAGRPVKVEVPLTRVDYERLIAPYGEKAVHLCRRLLKRNRLAPQDIDRLILVGGPSKTPFIQRLLRERLGIPFDISLDPMTVVAQGAALHAATLEVEDPGDDVGSLLEGVPDVHLDLSYERKSRLSTMSVKGRVAGEGVPAGPLWVEIRRNDGEWTSGRIPVAKDDLFEEELLLPKNPRPTLSPFTTTVFDAQGRILSKRAEPEIWYPFPDIPSRLASSLLVGLRDNTTHLLLKQGIDLPATGEPRIFHTAAALRQGESGDLLRIPVLEAIEPLLGETSPRAEDHIPIGTLLITGSDEKVTLDLPQDTEVEITIHHTASRETRVRAYIPLLDEEFEATFTSDPPKIEVATLQARHRALQRALAEIEEIHGETPLAEIEEALQTLRSMDSMAQLEREIERYREGETAARGRAFRALLQISGALRHLRDLQCPQRLARRLARLETLSNGEHRERLRSLREALSAAESIGREAELGAIEEALDEIEQKVRQQPYNDVLLSLLALNGQRVNGEQGEIFRRADHFLGEIDQRGGVEALTPEDLRRLAALHQEFVRAFPQLWEARDACLARLRAEGRGLADLHIGDLKLATAQVN